VAFRTGLVAPSGRRIPTTVTTPLRSRSVITTGFDHHAYAGSMVLIDASYGGPAIALATVGRPAHQPRGQP